jgi:hypothetical protein
MQITELGWYLTRGGQLARVTCVDREQELYPVVGYTLDGAFSWTRMGKLYDDWESHGRDLIEYLAPTREQAEAILEERKNPKPVVPQYRPYTQEEWVADGRPLLCFYSSHGTYEEHVIITSTSTDVFFINTDKSILEVRWEDLLSRPDSFIRWGKLDGTPFGVKVEGVQG